MSDQIAVHELCILNRELLVSILHSGSIRLFVRLIFNSMHYHRSFHFVQLQLDIFPSLLWVKICALGFGVVLYGDNHMQKVWFIETIGIRGTFMIYGYPVGLCCVARAIFLV